MANYYPIYLNLDHKTCVIIGGGKIAEGKIKSLMENNCSVTIISPNATEQIRAWSKEDKITWHKRLYRKGDLKGCFLAIAATDITEVNTAVSMEAEREGVLVNVVDHPSLCTYISPSVVKRGSVTIAISTGGTSPALARKLRELLDDSELLDYAELAPLLSKVRTEIKTKGFSIPPNKWQECINKGLIDMVRKGQEKKASDSLIAQLMSKRGPK